jgi:two-component system LytT family response regulator
MKPVSPDRLARALARVSAPNAAGDLPAAQPGRLEETDRVSLRSDRGLRNVRVLDITHIEADENYTRVHVKGHPPAFVRRPMSEWERVLPEALFLRVERSLIVQLRAVREVLAGSRDAVRVAMVGQPEPIVLARRASLRLRNALRAR